MNENIALKRTIKRFKRRLQEIAQVREDLDLEQDEIEVELSSLEESLFEAELL